MKKEIVDIQTVKKTNMKVVLDFIRRQKTVSRASIAKATCLTRTTVSSLIEELLNKDIIEEIGHGESNGGRKPVLLKLKENSHLVIGIDLSDEKVIRGYLCNLEASVLAKVESLYVNKLENILETISEVVTYLIEAAKTRGKVFGIGIGAAALVNPFKREILFSANFDISGVEVLNHLNEKFKLPVYIENESNAAAWAEKEYGYGRGFNTILYVSVQKGIGSGIIIDGKIYYGGFYGAGEIGHIMIDPNGSKCSCGAKGCLETLISQAKILERVKTELDIEMNLEELIDAYLSGNIQIKSIVDYKAVSLGKAMAIASNLLNVESIIIGGYITRYGIGFLELVEDAFKEHIIRYYRDKIYINFTKFGTDAVGIGGASLVLKQIWDIELI